MKRKQPYLGFMASLILGLALILGAGAPQPAQAGTEDAAMFYDELAQYGEWVDYDKYGPVWHPTQIEQDWRPYVNGRWVPTEQGQVFETQEPWGWATYHYGNWMPTTNYGWVWVPGRTWYPSTVTWRTSPETTPVDNSYVGWAPVPPPDYVPPPAYAPPNYYQGSPVADLISAPFWIFAAASKFLLGFGQPYDPGYSYGGCGCLAPPAYIPVIMPMAPLLVNYYTPAYYPPAFFGGGMGLGYGAYGWGPPVRYMSRVTNINQTIINNNININTTNIINIRNVRAPAGALTRNTGIRHIQPPALTQGHRLPPAKQVTDVARAQANLGKPNIVPPPKNVPKLTAQIPKAAAGAPPTKGIVGAGLPSKAIKPLTPGQQTQIQKLPPNKHITPATAPLTGKRTTPTTAQPGIVPPPTGKPGVTPPTAGKPGVTPPITGKPGIVPPPTGKPGVTPPTAGKPGVVPPPTGKPGVTPPITGKPGVVPPPTGKPGVTPPTTAKPGVTPPTTGKPGWKPPTTAKPGVTPPTTTTGPGATPPTTTTKPGAGVPLPPGYKGLSPAERKKLEVEHQRLQQGGKPSTTVPTGPKTGVSTTPPPKPPVSKPPTATTPRATTPPPRATTPPPRATTPPPRATTPPPRATTPPPAPRVTAPPPRPKAPPPPKAAAPPPPPKAPPPAKAPEKKKKPGEPQ